MRIAVLADTHNALPGHVVKDLAAADEVWHLGDVTDPATLEPLRELRLPLHVARGNCDGNESWPWVLDLEREGLLIRLIHIPPESAPAGVDLVLHGHTHIPRNERVGSARFFNPGSIGKPKHGVPASYAWLELACGRPPKWTVVRV